LVPVLIFDIIGWYLLKPYIHMLISEYGSQVYIKWFLFTSIITLWFPIIYTLFRVGIDWFYIVYLKDPRNFNGKTYLVQSLKSKFTALNFVYFLFGLPSGLGWTSLFFK